MSINSFILPTNKEKSMTSASDNIENINVDSTQSKNDMTKVDQKLNDQSDYVLGHDPHDQHLIQIDKQNSLLFQSEYRSLPKFDGAGNAEHWLKNIIDRFDSLQITSIERYELIPNVLIGDALIWYAKQQDHMPTFISFIKKFLQYYGHQDINEKLSTTFISSSTQMQQLQSTDSKEIVLDSLRNQMLINSLEKLPKFTGKSKQNVSKWLREIQQSLHMFKLSDEEKLFFIPSCLEADAKDWFYDNMHLFSTWTIFIQKLLKTFESSGKADISFNRLRHYEQGINQDVRQYYFEIMKLCKEANPFMDDASKLQYLKDGLKPTLRFDILLKNPTSPEEFLEYAQKIAELKSLDEQQDVIYCSTEESLTTSPSVSLPHRNNKSRLNNQHFPMSQRNSNKVYDKNNYVNNRSFQSTTTNATTSDQYRSNNIPKPPYQCYKCGGVDHYIYDCPHFCQGTKVNQIPMKIMFDSGSTTSFINKAVLIRTRHLPINYNKHYYLMADGHTTFEVMGTVRIFIELNHIKTNQIVGVVDSLCTDCILGMDYINKYKVNLNNKQKQVQVHTTFHTIRIPMENQSTKFRTISRLLKSEYLYPYQEKRLQIISQVSSGKLSFSPAYHVTKSRGLIISDSLIYMKNHTAWISVYNSTAKPCYLNKNIIIGIVTPLTFRNISTLLDQNTKDKFNDNKLTSSISTSEQHITSLLNHIYDLPQINELQTILKKHISLFDTSQTTIAQTSIPHVICTGDNPSISSKPYPQTVEKQNATFEIIQQMLRNKQIRASNSQYSSPILLIKKRDGSYRFVVDYRKLNQITIQDKFPLPNLEQTIQMVGGHEYYSKLDLRSGYFQIPIREADKHKTAFITVHGLYEFNVLAQGLKNSPPSFQRIMSNLLLPCKTFSLVYLDDILIYSDSFQQHLDHLNQVLTILNKHKFQLNPQKCELVRTTIDYLGHTISNQGIKPLQERIQKILDIPQPVSLNQANAFIGAIGWYRKFIKDYTKIAAPILAVTNLMKKHKFKFKWDSSQREAFDKLKMAITSEPLFLNYPDAHAPLILATDASDYCVGGVLYQEINGERKNIYFYSQMLPKLQRKWSTIEKEALGIYYCVIRMKLYLLGHEFIIQTDHCPLRDMHNKSSNNRRVDRISLVLQQFNIKEIRHIAGKCNCMADYLTRYPHQIEEDDEFLDSAFGHIPNIYSQSVDEKLKDKLPTKLPIISAVTTRAQAKAQVKPIHSNEQQMLSDNLSVSDDQPQEGEGHAFDISLIGEAQKQDKLYQEKILEINKNKPNCSYVLENDILYKLMKRGAINKKLIYVPSSMLKQLLAVYHDAPWSAHFGFRRTYFKVKDNYWWPDMKTSIRNYIQSCLKCQKFNIARNKLPGLLHPIEPPSGPFQLIGIDYSGPFPITSQGNKYVLAITDYFTKWVIAIPLSEQTAKTTAEALYEHYITIYGIPSRILSDQGSHFNNQLIAAFTAILGCHHIKSTTYHPQTNGAIERFNSTFERQLAKLTNNCISDWDEHLKSIVFAYNTGQHVTTKFTPYELQFGRQPHLPPEKPLTNYKFSKPNDYLFHLRKTLNIYRQHAINNIVNNQKNYKQFYDYNRPEKHYSIGDQVLKRIPIPPSKLGELYSNPMIVIKEEHPTYWIKDPDIEKTYQVHISQLRMFNFNRSSF
ncbi:unnamed protein product [Rotaria sp. Silwood2]|nr:unnamed protein product [Rotaria sp. Silwood2]